MLDRMKARLLGRRAAAAVVVFAIGCGGGDETGAISASLSCDGSDNLARMWGTFSRGELLLLGPDFTPAPTWPRFTHPTSLLLSFQHPPDWSGQPLTIGSAVGVDLVRSDAGGYYHQFTAFDSTGTSVSGWLTDSILRGFSAMADVGSRTEMCALPPTTVQTNFGAQRVSASVVMTEDKVLLSAVSLTFFDGLAGNGVTIQSYGGTRAQFNQIANDVFFVIIEQLLFRGGGELDSDLDGTPDSEDAFPLDPTRQ